MSWTVVVFTCCCFTLALLVESSKGFKTRYFTSHETSLSRGKRSMLGFHTAIKCYNWDVNVLASYATYGCFCGPSGEGIPIDETDKCCEHHDKCYAKANKHKPETSGFFGSIINYLHEKTSNMLVGYHNECMNGTIFCQTDDVYAKALCNCDRNAAICFAKNYHTFRPQFLNISTETYCYDTSNRTNLDYTVPEHIKQNRILISAEGILINENKTSLVKNNSTEDTTVSSILKNATQNEGETKESGLENETSILTNSDKDIESDKSSANSSRKNIYLLLFSLLTCFCCCYLFVRRYSKLPLFPFKKNSGQKFAKGVQSEKRTIESSYDEIKV